MSFLEPWPLPPEKEPPYVRGRVEEGYPSTNFKNEDHIVQVTDARSSKDQFSLDRHGFEWRNDPTLSDDVLKAIRSKDKELVSGAYYPLVEDLLKRSLGVSRVIIFDHTYRKRDPALNMKENPNGREQPATVVSTKLTLFW
jgi:hypothetical protein